MSWPPAKCFWLEPTDRAVVGMRRYASREPGTPMTCEGGYHSSIRFVGVFKAKFSGGDGRRFMATWPMYRRTDRRWPAECDQGCGYRFVDDDHWQMWQELIYRRADTGEERMLRSRAALGGGPVPPAEPGALWDAWWLPDHWRGPDGIALMARCPDGHDWTVDSEASNCTRKGEPHACWVRHGDPRTGMVHVDKDGDTCAAGAGSIATGDYHGFLHDGAFTAG